MIEYLKSKIIKRDPLDINIGKIQGSFAKREWLTESELNHHVHIVGASGYGKTVLLTKIIKSQIENGKGLIFIDLKCEMETLMKLSQITAEAGRMEDLQIFSLSNQNLSAPYNLLAGGTPTQLRDRVMISMNWSEEYYKNQAATYLLKLLIALVWLRDRRERSLTMLTLYRGLNSVSFIETCAKDIPEHAVKEKQAIEDCYRFIKSAEDNRSLQGLRSQIESLVLSDFGESITSDQEGINLFKAINENKIVLILLDSRRYGESAKAIGKFILQDLKAASSRIDSEVPREKRKPVSVIIDEFADLATEDFVSFLDRARSSKMSIVVAHQEIRDLFKVSLEFAARLMGNISTMYTFLQKGPDSADLIAKIAGTKTVRESTEQYDRMFFVPVPTGMMSVKTVEAYNVHPNVVKSLTVGKCVVIKKYPKSRSHVVRVSTD